MILNKPNWPTFAPELLLTPAEKLLETMSSSKVSKRNSKRLNWILPEDAVSLNCEIKTLNEVDELGLSLDQH